MKFIIAVFLLILSVVAFTGCEKAKRAVKDVESSFIGLDRIVTVYSLDGKQLRQYEGKIDISPGKCPPESACVPRILFENKGKRYAIYNATVIVEEK